MDGEIAAMALWFLNFSTWDGVEGIYLEDLYVRPRFRRLGLARGLLAALAHECIDNGYTRLSWAVLNWNTDAIALYRASALSRRASGPPTGCPVPIGRAGRTGLIAAAGPSATRPD